jgi:hypothetical protein
MKIRTVAMTGMMSLAGLGLVGVGAHAVFTTQTTSSQTITAGMPQVVLSSADASNGCTTIAIAEANPGPCSGTLTLNPPAVVGSTFETPASQVWVTNTGNIPVTETSIQMGDTVGNAAGGYLAAQMNVCLHSWDISYGPPYAGPGWVEANGPLSTAVALNPTVVENAVVIAPGASIWYSMEFYAGQDSLCGTKYSDGTHTAATWTAYDGGPYSTPASLLPTAEGGVVTPSFTYNYSS